MCHKDKMFVFKMLVIHYQLKLLIAPEFAETVKKGCKRLIHSFISDNGKSMMLFFSKRERLQTCHTLRIDKMTDIIVLTILYTLICFSSHLHSQSKDEVRETETFLNIPLGSFSVVKVPRHNTLNV